MSGTPPAFPGLQGPPTPEKIEQAIGALIAISRMLLGEERTRAVVAKALGDTPPPKVVVDPSGRSGA